MSSLPALNNTSCHQQGVVNILQKILFKFGERIESSTNKDQQMSTRWPESNYIIETVRGGIDDNNSDFTMMDMYSENEVDDIREVKMSQFVASLIMDCLHGAREKLQPSKLLVPQDLPQRVADDIMRMSLNEPCGVRGCAVNVILEDGDICRRIGKIAVDPSTVTTFELTLVLNKETPRWLMSKLQTYLRNSYEKPTVVKSSYKLIKRKLYRRDSHAYIREGL